MQISLLGCVRGWLLTGAAAGGLSGGRGFDLATA